MCIKQTESLSAPVTLFMLTLGWLTFVMVGEPLVVVTGSGISTQAMRQVSGLRTTTHTLTLQCGCGGSLLDGVLLPRCESTPTARFDGPQYAMHAPTAVIALVESQACPPPNRRR